MCIRDDYFSAWNQNPSHDDNSKLHTTGVINIIATQTDQFIINILTSPCAHLFLSFTSLWQPESLVPSDNVVYLTKGEASGPSSSLQNIPSRRSHIFQK